MPQLKSGRHVALDASPYLDAVSHGSDNSKYYAIVALRLNASTPQALCNHLPVVYFREDLGAPPDAPYYDSGYTVADILEGRSDWRPDEVDEFSALVKDSRFGLWLQAEFDELNKAIQDNSIWEEDLLEDDATSGALDGPTLMRAIVMKSAMQPDAMTKLRARAGKS